MKTSIIEWYLLFGYSWRVTDGIARMQTVQDLVKEFLSSSTSAAMQLHSM